MSKRVVITAAALEDLEWLTQPGSSVIAHRKLEDIHLGIANLVKNALLHPTDPDNPGSRLAVIHRYAVRFEVLPDGSVIVARVFGPGQKR